MITKTNLISDRDVNVLPVSAPMPTGSRHAARADVRNGGLGTAQNDGFVALRIGGGKTVAAVRSLVARCGRADVRWA